VPDDIAGAVLDILQVSVHVDRDKGFGLHLIPPGK
jgi:hypothetical protein